MDAMSIIGLASGTAIKLEIEAPKAYSFGRISTYGGKMLKKIAAVFFLLCAPAHAEMTVKALIYKYEVDDNQMMKSVAMVSVESLASGIEYANTLITLKLNMQKIRYQETRHLAYFW